MARLQVPQVIDLGVVNTTPKQISVTELNITSFILQAPEGNTDFIRLGNSTGQLYELGPGDTLAVHGDALDNGTYAYMNMQQWYVVAVSGTQTGNVLYLERF